MGWLPLVFLGVFGLAVVPAAQGYIAGPPITLGHVVNWSDFVMLARVDEVHRDRGGIVFRKVRDIKGKWPTDIVRHAFNPTSGASKSKPPLDAKERAYILDWAEKGKLAVLFALKSHGMAHTYIDQCWYGSLAAGREKDSWGLWETICPEPELLRNFCCGKPAELAAALDAMIAGKETVVPVVGGGTTEELRQGRTRIRELRVGLKILEFEGKRVPDSPKQVIGNKEPGEKNTGDSKSEPDGKKARTGEKNSTGKKQEESKPDLVGTVKAVSSDGKSFTLLRPPSAKRAEPTPIDIEIGEHARITAGNEGARLAVGQTAGVWLQKGSQNVARAVHIGKPPPERKPAPEDKGNRSPADMPEKKPEGSKPVPENKKQSNEN